MLQRLVLSSVLLGLCACDDLREFATGPDEVFVGAVVGSDSKLGQASFIRQGFISHTQMELTFDPALATLTVSGDAGMAPSQQGPGTLHTYHCPQGRARCREGERVVGPFDHARLLPIESLAHDALSRYTFPGGGRMRNYIFGARFQSALPEGPVQRHAMVFLSLMESGKIEVRVIAPSVVSPSGVERLPALFGVFDLQRSAR